MRSLWTSRGAFRRTWVPLPLAFLAAIWLSVAVPSLLVQASVGDRSEAFQDCTTICSAQRLEPYQTPGVPSNGSFREQPHEGVYGFSTVSQNAPFYPHTTLRTNPHAYRGASVPELATWPIRDPLPSVGMQDQRKRGDDANDPEGRCAAGLPLWLQWTQWTCAEDCAYRCMRAQTRALQRTGTPLVQYYGKWPFRRLAGLQEPAAVLFSVGNGWQHIKGLRAVWHWRSRFTGPHQQFQRSGTGWLALYALSSIHVWVWSVLFHARDTPLTERGDYLGAGWAGVTLLNWALIRVMGLPGRLLFPMAVIGFGFHAHRLLAPARFDYGYNMAFNVGVGAVHNVVWLVWAVAVLWKERQRRQQQLGMPWAAVMPFDSGDTTRAWMVIRCVVSITASMALELFDFPPILWDSLDAHALWHATTIPIIPMWYRFWLADLRSLKDTKGDATLPSRIPYRRGPLGDPLEGKLK